MKYLLDEELRNTIQAAQIKVNLLMGLQNGYSSEEMELLQKIIEKDNGKL
ncbi:hypothetical protein P4U05_20625 [Bacillus paranthracis]|nr:MULTISPECIES: hypothetical protein [Bacillus cereus group]MED1183617.1 hypothetical protein [Bacillus paranthracis]MED1211429.1 hypothetical protein [Bacillus paranthracis]MED1252315.1 hypothetical protein [Bacillus paranthracis]MED1259378.1 hypothetical protein [Bacillus paranthracis]MED1293123.1 hypothetical protein [Bacillus paranthracis]